MTEHREAGEAPPPCRSHNFEAPEFTAPHNPPAFLRWLLDVHDGISAGIAPKADEEETPYGRNAIAGDRRLYRFVAKFHFTVERGYTFESYKAGRAHFGGTAVTRHEVVTYLFDKSGIEYQHRKQVTNALTALISRGAMERANR